MVDLGAENPGAAYALGDFDFELPEDLVAQFPTERRDQSRLMLLERQGRSVTCGVFAQIVDLFTAGDLLVLNDTRVIPARLCGHKESGGQIEVLLVRRIAGSDEVWDCMTRSSKPPRAGMRLFLPEGIVATVLAGGEEPLRRLAFAADGAFLETLERAGQIPLPPYLRREEQALDRERYQTVFASTPGAVAAPTAGLHFTAEILGALRARGVEICPLTLHVGPGTFLPVRDDDVSRHRMHGEAFFIPEATAAAVNRAKREKRRVFALGTTTTRTLEHAAAGGELLAGAGETELFIVPGHRFRVVDAMVTNFHLPRSTLLMLVSAFAGREFLLQAYRQAVAERFRFYSYGDCMVIL